MNMSIVDGFVSIWFCINVLKLYSISHRLLTQQRFSVLYIHVPGILLKHQFEIIDNGYRKDVYVQIMMGNVELSPR